MVNIVDRVLLVIKDAKVSRVDLVTLVLRV